MMRSIRSLSCLLLITLSSAPGASRLKDLVTIEGVRENQLVGYGLVVGLAGTGDRRQTIFSAQSLTNLLERMGVAVASDSIRVNNIASVIVTATLPPFAGTGTRIDTTVAAIGDASNLQGGLLVLTSLRGVDGQVYAVAQGPVVTGGFVAGRQNSSQTVNHPTVGRIPNGAIVEKAAPSVAPEGHFRLQLRQADFTTSARLAEAVNKRFSQSGKPVAHAENSATIQIDIPTRYSGQSTEFVSELERITIETDLPARVVINERTGTIVSGKDVRISPVAIMHGRLTVEIQTNYTVSQPPPLSSGKTEVVPQVGVGVKEEKSRNLVLKQGATIEDLVHALSSIGAAPRDIIAILQSLRTAGALEAEVEVI